MAMMTAALKDGEPTSEINTTPLIDVMLVLLIMLIVTIPPQRQAVKMDTPRPNPDAIVKPTEPVRISVDFDGSYRWNGTPVTLAELDQRLAVEARRAVQPEIHIEPHRLAAYHYVVAVMASAQRFGLQKLGVEGGVT
ncbi:MAG: biopolymer transporter ExbD [Alphaproteobacteria bacterium]|nr:biopolymer transporter ExbD [Alphaproteobacteria bacterium]